MAPSRANTCSIPPAPIPTPERLRIPRRSAPPTLPSPRRAWRSLPVEHQARWRLHGRIPVLFHRPQSLPQSVYEFHAVRPPRHSRPPAGRGAAFQLNIKRDGAFTGEYLFYSTGPNPYPRAFTNSTPFGPADTPVPTQGVAMYWKLVTKRSTRSFWVAVDRATMQPLDKPHMSLDDDMGDPTAVPFAGPAIDLESLVFRLRRLPLAVGYKTTLTTHPLVLGEGFPQQAELTVTATETVQVVAGKFNCYKVSFGPLNQTFWIGIDGARPLVKMQSGKVEAELVKVWGPSVFDSAMAFLKTAGWTWRVPDNSPDQDFEANVNLPDGQDFSVHLQKTYTPPGDTAQALRQTMAEKSKALSGLRSAREVTVRPDSVQTRLIGGQQALICLIDTVDHGTSTDEIGR